MRWEIRNILINITNAALLVIFLFLVMRVLFRLFSANSTTPFVSWVYDVSAFFMAPFTGIFNSVNVAEAGILDVPALFALIVYALIGWVVLYVIRLITAGSARTDEYVDHAYEEHEHGQEHSHSRGQTRAHSH